jgi:hypothetical protein
MVETVSKNKSELFHTCRVLRAACTTAVPVPSSSESGRYEKGGGGSTNAVRTDTD